MSTYQQTSTPGFEQEGAPKWISEFSDFQCADDINRWNITTFGTTPPSAPSSLKADVEGGVVTVTFNADADEGHLWQSDEFVYLDTGVVAEFKARFSCSDWTAGVFAGFAQADAGTGNIKGDLGGAGGYGVGFRIDDDDALDCTAYVNGTQITSPAPKTDVFTLVDGEMIELFLGVYMKTSTVAYVVFKVNGDVVAELNDVTLWNGSTSTLCGTLEIQDCASDSYDLDYLGCRCSINNREV